MVEEHLKAIRSREEGARQRIREAEVQAAAILEAAREDGERRLEQVRIEASENERALLAEARGRAEKAIVSMRAENKEALSALEETAAGNEERALQIVTDSFREKL